MMGLSSDSPHEAVTETRSRARTGASYSPSESSANDQQPDVVEVNEDNKQDADTKDAKEQSASLSDYFVCSRSLRISYDILLTI